MFEDLFDFSDKMIPENLSPGMITFEEYLERKENNSLPSDSVVESSGMITFEEYLQRKNESLDLSSLPHINLDVEEDSIPEANGMITFLEYLEMKNLLVKEEDIEDPSALINPETTSLGYTRKSLWDGYVQHVKFQAKRAPIINIQDPKYLDESRAKYAEFLIEEQRKVHDQLYFFTGGGHIIQPEEEECAVIGKAVIGKNKIC